MAFGSPGFSQVFAQGVQMLSAAFDRAAQLEQNQAQLQQQYELKKAALDAKTQELKSQEKYQQLELQIKQAQATKIAAEAQLAQAKLVTEPQRLQMEKRMSDITLQLKEYDLADKKSLTLEQRETARQNKVEQAQLDVELKKFQLIDAEHKNAQLTVRAADPNPYSRGFDSVDELTREQARLQGILSDPFTSRIKTANFDPAQLKADLEQVRSSIVFRTDELAKRFNYTKTDAARPLRQAPPQDAAQAMAAGQISVAQFQDASSQPPAADYGKLVQGLVSQDQGVQAASKNAIFTRLIEAKKSGNRAVFANELNALRGSFPGTPEQQEAALHQFLDSAPPFSE